MLETIEYHYPAPAPTLQPRHQIRHFHSPTRPVEIAWVRITPVIRWLPMPIDHILSLLITERDKLTRAIEVLQGTSRGGRPRKSAVPTIDSAPTPNHTRKRPRWTAAMRRAASERAKVAYAERMKKAGKKR
jgi:hypothetical protein